MTSVQFQFEMDEEVELDSIKSAWRNIKYHLEKKRDRIYTEIKDYPPPIPACDQQFNFLLEERTRIAQVLNQIDKLAAESLSHSTPLQLLDQFIRSSPDIHYTVARKIRIKQR